MIARPLPRASGAADPLGSADHTRHSLPKLVSRLDIIINNACQTIRRPPQYYAPLLKGELDLTEVRSPPAVLRIDPAKP